MTAGIRSRLFDADGHDRMVDADDLDLAALGKRQLAWVDIDLDAGGTLDTVAGVLGLDDRDRRRIEADTARARVVQVTGRIHLTLEALEPEGSDDDDDAGAARDVLLVRREIDMLAAPNLVVTIHHGPVHALDRYAEDVAGDSSLGVLDAGDLLSGLVDEVIVGYYRLAEGIERDIDRLDEAALRGGRDDVLVGLVEIRRRVGNIRRVLAPHRHALAALARPEMDAETAIGRPWPGLVDRLEGAIDAIDGTRDALLGTYDIHMGRVAQRANDVMKALTLLSAVLLPAVVLAGIMGMNFEVPFFDEPANFYLVLGAMAAFAALLLGIARWRRWL
jgi:magnesium transporter